MNPESGPPQKKQEILVIPCSGIERLTGLLSSQIALELIRMGKENSKNISIEPSFAQIATEKDKFQKILSNQTTCILNGCGKQCTSKLLEKLNIKPAMVFSIPQLIKGKGFSPKGKFNLTEDDYKIATETAQELYSKLFPDKIEPKNQSEGSPIQFMPKFESWQEFIQSKFVFKVPNKKTDFYFNWNDAWVYIQDEKAVVGISDYLQQNMSDIIIIDLPEVGSNSEQLESLASIESTKTVIDLISPFTGKVVEVNSALIETPDLINADPYTKGWICVIEPTLFETELEDLMSPTEYFEHMKEKIEDEI